MKPVQGLVCAVLASCAMLTATADIPQPYIWWKMDKIVDGKIMNAGTNTDTRCDLTLGPSVRLESVYGVENALIFDASASAATGAWGYSHTPALKSRTVSFWIYRDADNSNVDAANNKLHYVFSGLSAMNIMVVPDSLAMHVKLGTLESTSEQIAHSYVYSAGNFTRDAWHHIVVVAEDTGRISDEAGDYFGNPIYDIRIYQDGALHKEVKDRVTESNLAVETDFVFGNNVANGVRPLPGAFSDVRLYDCALTTDDVSALWQTESQTHAPGVLGFWRMEEIRTEGDKRYVDDSTGRGVPLEVGADNVLMAATGLSGQALDFPDQTQCYGLAHNKSGAIRDFSVSLWMRPQLGMDKLQNEGNVGNKCPHIFRFGNYFRCAFGTLVDSASDINMFDMASVTNSSAPGVYINPAYMAKGYWNHFAFVAKAEQNSEGKWSVTPKYYANGELVATGRKSSCPDFEASGLYPNSCEFMLGNMGANSARAMWGQMDDVAFFGRALTAEQVKRLYHGLPDVEAGTDFSIAAHTARLAGSLKLSHGGDCDRAARQDSAAWSLVSAPEGASATIVSPDDLNTSVLLPTVGSYVFRLTASLEGLSDYDDVTVTRVDDLPGTTPALSVSAPSTALSGVPASLSASVDNAGNIRVFWSKVSGPGAVAFEPKEGLSTSIRFAAIGTYVLQAVADDGKRMVCREFSIDVSDGGNCDISNGLLGYWPLGASRKDEVSGTALDETHFRNGVSICPGISGYGAQVVSTKEYSLVSRVGLQESPLYPDETEGNRNTIPKERWRSLSMWIRYDPQSDTNNACGSVLAEVQYTLGLFYDKTNGTDRIAMYQQTMCPEIAGGGIDYYTADTPPFDGRWVHVYAAFDRQTSPSDNQSELWIDGVRQHLSGTRVMGGGRVNANPILFGNLNVSSGTAGANNRWDNRPRTFPGALDEIRLYNRKLSEAEIRFLAANPVVDVNYAPAVDVAIAPTVKGKPAATSVLTADDGMPTGAALKGRWVVIAGDASKLKFADQTAEATTVTASKAGTYTFAYAVTDGEKTTYSDPKVLEVHRAGLVFTMK